MESRGLRLITMATDQQTRASFFELTPDRVLAALDSHGYSTTGRYRTLNSYENRVFDVELELENPSTSESEPLPPSVIVKFYRPNRWSEATILEEHSFLAELKNEGVPVAVPFQLSNTSTLCNHDGLWMAIFPKIRGRLIEEILPAQVPQLGRWLASLHNIGAKKDSLHRPTLKPNYSRLGLLKAHLPLELWSTYLALAEQVFAFLDSALPRFKHLRVHGDFHRGNLIWNDDWTLIDFDDYLMAPAAQDFWIILSQLTEEEQTTFVEAYQELRAWDPEEQFLLEPLRAYRIVHYSTWIAERWDDPSFPHLFPNFHDYNFWTSEILELQKIIES